ncbi:hypothetical protein F4813DRAFT_397115 [Daldinia decipiens]|uniref:uncharacterized protein n=1 Tax=Daldinia decipiens TaxID=326647 RepID=UPI0020C1D646|nr:uncharacterized protein F4813DRAFT_397115 [Daldinia decipiens]KAI1656830.1 hypothetical protein F4813DRAFT_397115 [Daldinia decipiens]
MSSPSEQMLLGSNINDSEPSDRCSQQIPVSLPLLERPLSTRIHRPHHEWIKNDSLQEFDTTDKPSWMWALGVWKFQLFASLLSSASVIGLAVIAATFSGRPLSDWPLDVISINGVVAILTTLMKGLMMVLIADSIGQAKWSWFSRDRQEGRSLIDLELIDNASRGPWGSLIWLSKHPFRLHFVSFGALLTMLVAGVDVFSQLLVTVEDRAVIDTQQTAHVPWAINNDAVIQDSTWAAAILSGMYSTTIDDLPVSCPSGNCTWDGVVPLVGVCGKCTNITQMLSKTWMSCSELSYNYSITGYVPNVINGPRTNSTWNFSQLSSSILEPPNGKADHGIPVSVAFNYFDLADSIGSKIGWNESDHIVLGDFAIFDIPVTITTGSNITGFIASFGEPVVTRCYFWYCMQGITVSVDSSQQKETVELAEEASIARFWNWTYAPYGGAFRDVPGFNMLGRNFSVNSLEYTGANLQPIYPFPNVTMASVISSTPAKVFTPPLSYENGATIAEAPFSISEPAFFQAWKYTMDDRSAWCNRIAKSLTNMVRLQNQPSREEDVYAGNVWIHQIYIRVYWPWIAYPITILLASLILFAGNIYRSLKPGQRAWGNRTLALLLSDIDSSVKDLAKDSYRSNDELVKATGKAMVRLEEDGSGWAFRHKKD